MRSVKSVWTVALLATAVMVGVTASRFVAAQNPTVPAKTQAATLPTIAGTGPPTAPAPPPVPTPPPDPAAVAAARAEFDKVFKQWKQLLEQLRTVRQEYSADGLKEEPRQEIEVRFVKLMNQGEALLPKLVDAAVAAYSAQGGNDAQLAQLLYDVAIDEFQRDNYEPAALAARTLVGHDVTSPQLVEIAGLSAFHVNDFNNAEKYLMLAAKSKSASDDVKKYLPEIARQKEAWQREQQLRAAEAKTDDLPRVKLQTPHGNIVIELFENEAPNTVANFISLAEAGYFNGLTFHRVLAKFMAQGGLNEKTGGPGYTIAGEARDDKKYRRHFRGSVSMALVKDDLDSGNAEFFITFVPTLWLNGQHTVFGRVVEGMNVLSRIKRRDPQANPTYRGDAIIKAAVIRKRNHKYEPQKVSQPATKAAAQGSR